MPRKRDPFVDGYLEALRETNPETAVKLEDYIKRVESERNEAQKQLKRKDDDLIFMIEVFGSLDEAMDWVQTRLLPEWQKILDMFWEKDEKTGKRIRKIDRITDR